MENWKIYSRDGEVMYEGRAKTQRRFLGRLLRQRVSLANADLSGLSLAGFNMEGMDLTNADLTEADLRGANLKGANLKGAILDRAELHGANLIDALMQGCSLIDAKLSGVSARRVHLRGAILDGADFQQANMANSILTYTSIQKSNFSDADLTQADFGSSLIIQSKFQGADLRSDDSVPADHQADRTRNAVIVSCEYDRNTKFEPKITEAFKRDRLRTKTGLAALSATTSMLALGLFSAAETMLPGVDLASMVKESGNLGIGLIAAISVPSLLLMKDKAQDGFKELVGGTLVNFSQKVRKTLNDMKVRRTNLKNLVVACADEVSMAPLRRALTATQQNSNKQGLLSQFRYATSKDLGAFIICDRRHLSEALGAISSNRMRGYNLSKEILLLRYLSPREDESVPAAVRFHKNGETTMVWTEDGDPRHVVLYDNSGQPKACLDLETGKARTDVSDIPNAADIFTATESFEQKILEDHGMQHFHYPTKTHFVHAGRDGSVIVRRMRDRKLDNPIGPALITPEKELYAHNGIMCDDAPEPAEAQPGTRSFRIFNPNSDLVPNRAISKAANERIEGFFDPAPQMC